MDQQKLRMRQCLLVYLLLLVSAKLKVFAPLDGQLFTELALGTFHL